MRACWRCARLTALLMLLFCTGSSSSALNYFNIQGNGGFLSGRMRQSDDTDYESFIGLMGKRSTGPNAGSPPKWDMDDVFIGLLGRRSSEFGTSVPKIYVHKDLFMDNRKRWLRQENNKIRFQRTV